MDLARLRAYWTNRPPVARFTLQKTTWEVGENLRATEDDRDGFIDETRDPDWNIARETVDWGDGSEQSTYSPPGRFVVVPNWAAHSYDTAGTYTITLTATDSYGASSVKERQVTVTDPTGGTGVIWM